MSSAPSTNPTKSKTRFRLPRPQRRNGTAPTPAMDARMSLISHIKELRDRLIRVVIGVIVTTTLAFVFIDGLIGLFISRVPAGVTLQVLQPGEKFASYFKVALTFGLAAAMPIIVYQLFRFLSPGLMSNERKVLLLGMPMITAFFVAGAVFCYFILLPPAINFLYSFGDQRIESNWRLSEYIGFVTNFVLAAGLAFQLPPIMFMLSKLGIVTAKRLSGFRRYAIVLSVLAAAIITPTTDPFNLMMLAIPMYLLYELGVLMAKVA